MTTKEILALILAIAIPLKLFLYLCFPSAIKNIARRYKTHLSSLKITYYVIALLLGYVCITTVNLIDLSLGILLGSSLIALSLMSMKGICQSIVDTMSSVSPRTLIKNTLPIWVLWLILSGLIFKELFLKISKDLSIIKDLVYFHF